MFEPCVKSKRNCMEPKERPTCDICFYKLFFVDELTYLLNHGNTLTIYNMHCLLTYDSFHPLALFKQLHGHLILTFKVLYIFGGYNFLPVIINKIINKIRNKIILHQCSFQPQCSLKKQISCSNFLLVSSRRDPTQIPLPFSSFFHSSPTHKFRFIFLH